MIDTSDFKNGLNIFVDGEPYSILWFQNHKPGKGGAVMRTKLKHLRKGSIVDKTFKSGEKFDSVDVERRKKQYLYADTESFHFMDQITYDQIAFPKERMGEQAGYLKENIEVNAIYLEGELVTIELPLSVELKVVSSAPGAKGDTVSSASKPATVETGIDVAVPLFIKEGDVIKVDTRTGEYLERVQK